MSDDPLKVTPLCELDRDNTMGGSLFGRHPHSEGQDLERRLLLATEWFSHYDPEASALFREAALALSTARAAGREEAIHDASEALLNKRDSLPSENRYRCGLEMGAAVVRALACPEPVTPPTTEQRKEAPSEEQIQDEAMCRYGGFGDYLRAMRGAFCAGARWVLAAAPAGKALERIANHSTDDSDFPHTVEAMQAFARATLAGTAPQGMRELRKCLDEYEAAWGAALQLSAIADTEPERQAAKIKASSLYGRCVEIRAALGLSSEKGQGL